MMGFGSLQNETVDEESSHTSSLQRNYGSSNLTSHPSHQACRSLLLQLA